jgi:hypothetical protein
MRYRRRNITLRYHTIVHHKVRLPLLAALVLLVACRPHAAAPPSIRSLMTSKIDPSADALWDAVGTYVTAAGTENRRPHTAAQWSELRERAVILSNAADLLTRGGLRVADEGETLENEGVAGNLNAAQAQQAIDANLPVFAGFAHALRKVGGQLVSAAEHRDADAVMDAGTSLAQVCEGCHVQFWYPTPKDGTLP